MVCRMLRSETIRRTILLPLLKKRPIFKTFREARKLLRSQRRIRARGPAEALHPTNLPYLGRPGRFERGLHMVPIGQEKRIEFKQTRAVAFVEYS
ncbi:hypothetical protein L596_011631 [Steinernema carpocapsae]|uniref:Uncharacterized protein n=1 Tax=Steinernema carpocapsae TaxID=34508 RepID=A0A4U5NUI6_STECR|nr:hypothetical protein L596_011631 [Steinernema carpocapsae]